MEIALLVLELVHTVLQIIVAVMQLTGQL